MKLLPLLVALAVVGLTAATILLGARAREETVVAHPYEAGLAYDQQRMAMAPAGHPSTGPDRLTLRQAQGERPYQNSLVLSLPRHAQAPAGHPSTGPDRLTLRQAQGERPYENPLVLSLPRHAQAPAGHPSTGPDRLTLRQAQGERPYQNPLVLSLSKHAQASAGRCDLGAGPCVLSLGGAELTLELAPRPLAALRALAVDAQLRAGGAPVDGAELTVSFAMPGMEMGRNEVRLAPGGAGRYHGQAVLVRCQSGRHDWQATISVRRDGREDRAVLAVGLGG